MNVHKAFEALNLPIKTKPNPEGRRFAVLTHDVSAYDIHFYEIEDGCDFPQAPTVQDWIDHKPETWKATAGTRAEVYKPLAALLTSSLIPMSQNSIDFRQYECHTFVVTPSGYLYVEGNELPATTTVYDLDRLNPLALYFKDGEVYCCGSHALDNIPNSFKIMNVLVKAKDVGRYDLDKLDEAFTFQAIIPEVSRGCSLSRYYSVDGRIHKSSVNLSNGQTYTEAQYVNYCGGELKHAPYGTMGDANLEPEPFNGHYHTLSFTKFTGVHGSESCALTIADPTPEMVEIADYMLDKRSHSELAIKQVAKQGMFQYIKPNDLHKYHRFEYQAHTASACNAVKWVCLSQNEFNVTASVANGTLVVEFHPKRDGDEQ